LTLLSAGFINKKTIDLIGQDESMRSLFTTSVSRICTNRSKMYQHNLNVQFNFQGTCYYCKNVLKFTLSRKKQSSWLKLLSRSNSGVLHV